MLRGDGGEYVTMDSLDMKGCVMCWNPQTRKTKSHVQRRCSSYLTQRSDALSFETLLKNNTGEKPYAAAHHSLIQNLSSSLHVKSCQNFQKMQSLSLWRLDQPWCQHVLSLSDSTGAGIWDGLASWSLSIFIAISLWCKARLEIFINIHYHSFTTLRQLRTVRHEPVPSKTTWTAIRGRNLMNVWPISNIMWYFVH